MVRVLLNPCGIIFGKTERINEVNPISVLVKEIKKQEGLDSLEILVSNETSDIASIGNPLKTSFIVLPKALNEYLDEQEIRSVIIHEIYHIKEDVKMQTINYIQKYMLDKPLSLLRLSYCVITSLVLSGLVGYFANRWGIAFIPRGESAIQQLRIVVFIFWLVFILVLTVCIVVLTVAIRYKKEFGRVRLSNYLYLRELFADAYSVFKTEKPEVLRTALSDCLRLKVNSMKKDNRGLLKVKFVEQTEPSVNSEKETLKDMFSIEASGTRKILEELANVLFAKPLKFKTACDINSRFRLIDILEKLINNNVKIKVKKSVLDFEISTSNLPPQVYRYIKKNPNVFANFNRYLIKNAQNFNIKDCSSEIGAPLFEVFLMLIADIELEFVELE
jgi:hypothetical protein